MESSSRLADEERARAEGRQAAFAEAIRIIQELNASMEALGVFATPNRIIRAIRERMDQEQDPAGGLTR